MAGRALLIALSEVDAAAYGGFDGRDGCAGAAADLARMSGLLQSKGIAVTTLFTGEATWAAVQAQFAAATAGTAAQDLVVVYFSGHGRDGAAGAELCLFDQAVPHVQLDPLWTSLPFAARLVTIFDCCSSTAAGAPPLTPGLQAARVHLGASRPGGTALGGPSGSVYTRTLVDVAPAAINYRDLHQRALSGVHSAQSPQIFMDGPAGPSITLVLQRPFQP